MMAAKQVMLTKEGLAKYQEELETLRNVKRKEVSEKIKVARSFGDLSENSEYDEAKNEQAKIEARIADLEAMLKDVQIISEEEQIGDKAHIGSKVKVLDVEFNEEEVYQLVGSAEADPRLGKISDDSPVGRAIIGHSAGEVLDVETPGGTIQIKIVEIL
ncbi:MAG: transcription elongation factor GreA [Clostridia bacterium]|nr:transcription elongation factor GreA [Clostridia bacterium]